MLSATEMQAEIYSKVAELMVASLAERLKTEMQEQWNKVIDELVSTRKSNLQLEKAFNSLIESNNRVINFIESLQKQTVKNAELQEKEDKLLSFLMKEFGMEE